jgi:hypothetical protein
MARQKNNIVMRSTRGMVGKQIVFKKRAGKPYVAAPPDVNENRKPTPGQQAARERFKSAIAYAAAAIKDPAVKQAYADRTKRGQAPHNVAFQDAFLPPVVQGIITQGYHGQVGDVIVVHAQDDFKVNAVRISIRNAADELVEEGAAAEDADGLSWSYTVTQANANVAGSKITATAIDIPENEGSLEVAL